MKVFPISIKQISGTELEIIWNDEHKSIYELSYLRRECPCASCKGETILWKHYGPTKQIMIPTLEMTQLVGIEPIGNYAIQLIWKDGHNSGIYNWEYLRALCECEECKREKNSND